MVSRRYRANRSVGNKLLNLQDKVIQQQKTGKTDSIAAQAITDANIMDGTIQGVSLDDRAVTSDKIARGAVTTSNLGIINTVNSDASMVLRMGGTGHLALEGDAYESPYDGLATASGLYIMAFDPADNAVKIVNSTPGNGTVTSITAGTGLSASTGASPITTSGTLNVTDAALNPPGAIIMFGSATPPSGWLLCNGQSTSGYTALASVVGATVPDLRDRFIVGAGSTYAQGATGGSTSHSHTLSDSGYAKIRRANNRVVMDEVASASWTADNEITATGSSSSQGGSTATGLGGATDATVSTGSFLPPYYALTYIIKT